MFINCGSGGNRVSDCIYKIIMDLKIEPLSEPRAGEINTPDWSAEHQHILEICKSSPSYIWFLYMVGSGDSCSFFGK